MSQAKRTESRSTEQNVKTTERGKQSEELVKMIKIMEEGSKKLISHYALKAEEETKMKDFRTDQKGLIKSWDANPTKNRAGTEHCLEAHRFILKDTLPGDYIHASIVSKQKPKRGDNSEKMQSSKTESTKKSAPKGFFYIATQAPKLETVTDFWRMVWLSKSRLIVSLTNLKDLDKGYTTCYWPQRPTEVHRYGPVLVHNMAFREEDNWVETLLEICYYGEGIRRRITHLMYADWDDKRAPLTGRSLSAFRHKMRDTMKNQMKLLRDEKYVDPEKGHKENAGDGPVIVQCSNGAGRSGALIVLDISMEDMEKRQKHDTLENNLDLVREQLPGAVQTQNQFIAIYLANMIHGMRINPDLKLEDFKLFAIDPP